MLDKIRKCASDLNLSKHTTFGVEVTLVQAASAGLGCDAVACWAHTESTECSQGGYLACRKCRYTVHYRDIASGQNNQLTADAIMCCTGILGVQYISARHGMLLPDVVSLTYAMITMMEAKLVGALYSSVPQTDAHLYLSMLQLAFSLQASSCRAMIGTSGALRNSRVHCH